MATCACDLHHLLQGDVAAQTVKLPEAVSGRTASRGCLCALLACATFFKRWPDESDLTHFLLGALVAIFDCRDTALPLWGELGAKLH